MVKKTKDPSSTAEKKITTLVKVEILARTWKQKKWDQDVGQTGLVSVTGLVTTVGGSVCPATET